MKREDKFEITKALLISIAVFICYIQFEYAYWN